MRFRFCGDADCPDWVLAEINTLSKLSSVKLKLLALAVADGVVSPPINMEKIEKIFTDSKLDIEIDMKACISCISFILTSAVRFNCDHNALHSELQQLGLPREHSTSIKRIVGDYHGDIATTLRNQTLKVNALEKASANADLERKCATVDLLIGEEYTTVTLTPYTLDVLINNLKEVKPRMQELAS